jgi:hypothetical protein
MTVRRKGFQGVLAEMLHFVQQGNAPQGITRA